MNKLITAILLTLLLTSCGFQPRGELPQLQANLSPMQIRGLGISHQFRRILEERLDVAGITLGNKDNATTILHIFRVKNHRQVLSLDERNKTVEYEITVKVDFKLLTATGEEMVTRQSVITRHILFNPGDDLLGRTQEETLLRRDMYKTLSNQLIIRLQHQAK